MSESMQTHTASEHPGTTSSAFGVVWGVGNLLKTQTDFLSGFEPAVSDWLRRRHEALLDTQQLAVRFNSGGDPSELLKAQRDWVSRSLRRLAADADAYQSAAQNFVEHTRTLFPLEAPNGESAASHAAATRAAGRPLRVTNKPD